MKPLSLAIALLILICQEEALSQAVRLEPKTAEAVGVQMSFEKLEGKEVVKVSKDPSSQIANAPAYARIKGVDFKNGTIEVKLLSRLLKDAGEGARGFIGLAFRVAEDNKKFECIYIRPTNGRADDQVRRNHSVQYTSYPDYSFDRFRKESPEKYESYADMGLNEWITLRIEVDGVKARLFINDSKQPVLIVNDLKLGEVSGGVGLFVDNGTEGFFADLKVTKQ
jgi:hypothetical protein